MTALVKEVVLLQPFSYITRNCQTMLKWHTMQELSTHNHVVHAHSYGSAALFRKQQHWTMQEDEESQMPSRRACWEANPHSSNTNYPPWFVVVVRPMEQPQPWCPNLPQTRVLRPEQYSRWHTPCCTLVSGVLIKALHNGLHSGSAAQQPVREFLAQ